MISLTIDNHVARLTLDRPEVKNAVNREMLMSLDHALDSLGDARVVVVTGAGSAFCAGADLGAMAEIAQAGSLHDNIAGFYAPFVKFAQLEMPTIAAVNGAAVGAGLGLALMADLRVVAHNAKIGANFVKLGIHPGLGITAMLPAAVGAQKAAAMLLTGEIVRSQELPGFALETVDRDEVIDRAMAIAKQIASASPAAVRLTKQTLRTAAQRADLDTIRALEARAQTILAAQS